MNSFKLKSLVVHDVEDGETDEELLTWAAEYMSDQHIKISALSPKFSLRRDGDTAEIFVNIELSADYVPSVQSLS